MWSGLKPHFKHLAFILFIKFKASLCDVHKKAIIYNIGKMQRLQRKSNLGKINLIKKIMHQKLKHWQELHFVHKVSISALKKITSTVVFIFFQHRIYLGNTINIRDIVLRIFHNLPHNFFLKFDSPPHKITLPSSLEKFDWSFMLLMQCRFYNPHIC